MDRFDVVRRGGTTFTRRARTTARERGEHGREAYAQGCRCPCCVDAFRAYHRARYAARQLRRQGVTNRRVPVRRAARRLAALTAAGWTVPKLAAEAGCSCSTVWRILRTHRRGLRAQCWSALETAVLAIPTAPAPPMREPEADGLRARGYTARFVSR